jgi:hypothetical protein
MPPNGVEVRGLRVLRTYEERRVSWWLYLLDALTTFGMDYHWSVLTVSNGQAEVVARRRFVRKREAEASRRRFVRLVEHMSEDDYVTADWQAVLDQA